MAIHKEGYTPIALCILFIAVLNALIQFYSPHAYAFKWIIYILSFLLFVAILVYFRSQAFNIVTGKTILSPCDGEIVYVKETEDTEFMQGKCIQVSISPVSIYGGTVKHFQYQPNIYYVKEGDVTEYGPFFDSLKRDLTINVFLPIGTKINVEPGAIVESGNTILAELKA